MSSGLCSVCEVVLSQHVSFLHQRRLYLPLHSQQGESEVCGGENIVEIKCMIFVWTVLLRRALLYIFIYLFAP